MQTDNASNQSENSTKNYLIAALVIMFGLTAFLGYLYWNEKQSKESISQQFEVKNRELISTNTRMDSISNQLDDKIAEIRSLGGNIDELMKVKAQLESDKASLLSSKTGDTKKYEEKIRYYTRILAEKDKELATLRQENKILSGENEQLSTANEGLKSEITTTKQVYRDTVSALSSKNRELSDKVTVAAALKAQNVMVYAINGRGKEKERIRAGKIDQVRVAFNLADNPLTERAGKDIFVRILDPSGALISDMATGSGAFIQQGKEMIYTAKKRVTYSGNNQAVDFLYQRNQPFSKGTHTVELFSEGFKIGQGTFEVKGGLF